MALTIILLVIVCLAVLSLFLLPRLRQQRLATSSSVSNAAPMPGRPWPIIGHLHHLRGPRLPYQKMTDLAQVLGPIYSLQLGTVPALVVSGLENIKQVLFHKSHQFDSRPNFNRYHQLFDGDKNNSLAFCDWSEVQKKRRELLNHHTFPKVYSSKLKTLNNIVSEEVQNLLNDLDIGQTATRPTSSRRVQSRLITEPEAFLSKKMIRLLDNKHISTFVRLPKIEEEVEVVPPNLSPVDVKKYLLEATATIFLKYFCSTKTEKTEDFTRFVKDYDKIFYEVNQGYASDFLPFLEKFSKNKNSEFHECSKNIRSFVEKEVVGERLEKLSADSKDKDYLDTLLRNVKFGDEVQLNMNAALFSLEDILGGHSAVANFLTKLLTFLVDNETVQNSIIEEIRALNKDFVTIEDCDKMPYTEAVIMEALRLISSPIVPHVANQDTNLCGYDVKKGTLVFLNNYELNMSEDLWEEPQKFDPSRFLDPTTGKRIHPAHFLPFGGGRRSCMGYKMVQLISFAIISNLVGKYKITGVPGEKYEDVPMGNLALPEDTVKFLLEIR